MKAAKLEIGIRSQESGARIKESEGRRKKCCCKYEILPIFGGLNIRLEPDVAEMFPDSEAVNEVLRFLMRITK
ncbi:hypothetical protein QUB11_02635 [Microcoleus sp. B6-A1]|uniref:hypothetical protein n=1 Tax=Microcoleus sp. B6-A1 TaxID=2818684 RepID=UPI002FD56AB2